MMLCVSAVLCPECGGVIPEKTGPGRPRSYCSDKCRRRGYERRRLAAERGEPVQVVHRIHVREKTRTAWARPSTAQIEELVCEDPEFLARVLGVVASILREDPLYRPHVTVREQVGKVLVGWYAAAHSPGNETGFWGEMEHEPPDWDQVFGTEDVARRFTEQVRTWGTQMKLQRRHIANLEAEARNRAEELESKLILAHGRRREALAASKRLLKSELALAKYELTRERQLANLALRALSDDAADEVFHAWSAMRDEAGKPAAKYRGSAKQRMRREERRFLEAAERIEETAYEEHDRRYGTDYANPEDHDGPEDTGQVPPAQDATPEPGTDELVDYAPWWDPEATTNTEPWETPGMVQIIDNAGQVFWVKEGEDPPPEAIF